MTPNLILLSPDDNVLVAIRDIAAGEAMLIDTGTCHPAQAIGLGHKVARADLPAGSVVIKLGAPIGVLSHPVARGDLVHGHNLASAYIPNQAKGTPSP
jgi:(2R)-sulfolactate sulfo-lyase subunit alpha